MNLNTGLFLSMLMLSPILLAQPSIEKLPATINTVYDEINPLISQKEEKLFFTRVGHPGFDKTLIINEQDINKKIDYLQYLAQLSSIYTQLGEKKGLHPTASGFNQDIWQAETRTTTFDFITHPAYPLNNALPNSACAFTTDEDALVVLNQFYENGSMYKGFSIVGNDGANAWQFPETINIYDYDNAAADVDMCLSYDNEVMIISLQKEWRDNADLYVSFRVHTHLWSAPKKLPSTINTLYSESSPYLSRNQRLLFFSSNRPNGYGGSDIYMSVRQNDGWEDWSTPEILAPPINTEFDEAHASFDERNKWLYFCSTRDGSSDIYRSPYGTYTEDLTTDPVLAIRVISAEDQTPIAAFVAIEIDEQPWLQQHVQSEGAHLQLERQNNKVRIKAVSPGFLSGSLDVSTQHLFESQSTVSIQLPLFPIRKDSPINIENLFFEQGKATILKKSYPELNRLGDILKLNPKVHIEVRGHTDNVGDKGALLSLSKERAEAIKAFLVNMGVDSHRISTKGFGDTIPLNKNTSEKQKSKNRRVEVIITQTA